MKKLHYLFLGILVFTILLMPMGCKKSPTTPQTPVTTDTGSLEINQFIYYNLSAYYLWTDSVPKLNYYVYFHNSADSVNNFLSQYTDHAQLFYSLLYKYPIVDRYSWIVDDYVALLNLFQGITKSLGYSYGLARIGTSNNIFGYVQYVVKGSPADNAGVKRGNIFTKINDQQLTVSNYQTLLTDTIGYKLSFDTIVSNNISLTGRTASMVATVVNENPVYYDTIFNVNNYKVGYLVYNGFMSDYDIQLNQIFSTFKGAGVNKLILDLRYNGGGSTQSAQYLASMIYSTAGAKVFTNYTYNTGYENYLLSNTGSNSIYFKDFFTDIIAQNGTTTPQTPISNLGLTDLYVITTGNTASASELIINGLRPYINVVTIGDTTYGKNVGSMTILDLDSNGVPNPNHKWALQPIIVRMSNSLNQSNYGNVGFAPTVYAPEDYGNILPFGNPNETMLKAALDYIKGLKSAPAPSRGFRKIADSKDFIPHSKEMYTNKPIQMNFLKKKSSWK